MKNLIITALLFVLALAGCEKKAEAPQYEIYENHNISACGVDDPLRNLDWLAEFTANYKDEAINVTIYLYANIETKEENIVMMYRLYTYSIPGGSLETMDPHFADQVYSCSGERLFVDSSEEHYKEWDDYFYSGKNESKGIIWYISWYKSRIK